MRHRALPTQLIARFPIQLYRLSLASVLVIQAYPIPFLSIRVFFLVRYAKVRLEWDVQLRVGTALPWLHVRKRGTSGDIQRFFHYIPYLANSHSTLRINI